MINLYEDQQEFVDKLRYALREGYKSILGVASPAFGKTVVAGHIIAQARAKRNASAWFLVHRKNLLRQTSQSFWKAHIEHGLITSGKARSPLPIQVGTIGTVHSRMKDLTPPDILFIDEAHLSKGNMFSTVINWCKQADSIVIGLTGTPIRLDGKPLGDLYDTIVEAKSTAWLIEQGRLSDYDIFSTPIKPDLSGVKNQAGDYNIGQLAKAMNKPVLIGDAVSHWKTHAFGMRTVVYCCNVNHSIATTAAFNAAGIPAVHVDGNSTEAEIKAACEGMATGRYLILSCCELLIEGFDLSAQVGKDVTLECCILLRPTQSLARYLQMIFRALRKKPKKAVILDHAGCAMKHGLPDDEREWSLDGKKKGKRKSSNEPDIGIQECSNCRKVFRSGVHVCPHCGAAVEFKERKIEVQDGELIKIDRDMIVRERKIEQGQARSIEDLVMIGVRRGMKNPAGWAACVFAARSGRKPTREEYSRAKQALRSAA